jgi:hypothetical protein
MSSDSPGGDGKGGQNQAQNEAAALAANARAGGHHTYYEAADAARSALNDSQSSTPQNSVASISSQSHPSYANRSFMSGMSPKVASVLSQLDPNISVESFADIPDSEIASALGGYPTYEDPSFDDPAGQPPSFGNLVELQNAMEKSKNGPIDWATGTRKEAEFGNYQDPDLGEVTGWHSADKTTAGDRLTSPAATGLASLFGVPALVGFAADLVNDKYNEYDQAEVMDYTKDYGGLFGNGVPFTDSQRAQAFGGDNGYEDNRTQYYPTQTAQAPVNQPTPSTSPYDPRAYIKQNQSWTGDQFNLAPFIRRDV